MKYIYAYKVWQHECGPYSRITHEFVDVDTTDASNRQMALGNAVMAVRERYPQDKGYYCSIPALKPIPATELVFDTWGGE